MQASKSDGRLLSINPLGCRILHKDLYTIESAFRTYSIDLKDFV